ncbi:MAG TPA: molybdenum cofactor guanylyltransferase [Chthoniobacterales bacterium]|nr:molybdenum cofactor guanylyltransferase [Chthoniobacterales bacterium]
MTISAVLLAGGKSSRMGQDKATMLFRGGPLWKKQLELLRRIQPKKIFISAQSDPAWRPADVDFVPDDRPSRGPLSGIAAALTRITTNHLLVLAIDVPFMSEAYLRKLGEQTGAGQGIVPVMEDRAEPLAAIYPIEAKDEFLAALSGNDFSLQLLVRKLIAARKLGPIDVSIEERSLFGNLNEPGDVPNG